MCPSLSPDEIMKVVWTLVSRAKICTFSDQGLFKSAGNRSRENWPRRSSVRHGSTKALRMAVTQIRKDAFVVGFVVGLRRPWHTRGREVADTDTHVLLAQEALEACRVGADHSTAGDVGKPEIVEELKKNLASCSGARKRGYGARGRRLCRRPAVAKKRARSRIYVLPM